MAEHELIYLDHNATTPLDPRVFERMRPFLLERCGNAASRQHAAGQRAHEAVESSRAQLAALLACDPREIVWTSGATEADNLALKGVAHAPAYRARRRIVTLVTEHKAVLDPCAALEQQGWELVRLPVEGDGSLDLQRLREALTPETLLVSAMHANNETGLLHPLAEIGQLCREHGVLFHTDATQSLGKQPIDVGAQHVDLLACSAHKLHGPMGVGALYVRRRDPRVRCQAQLDGGGHERGLRSGTLNVAGIVGFGAAAELCAQEMDAERERVGALRDALESGLLERCEGARRNGGAHARLANTANLSFPGVKASALMERLPELALSSSAACTSSSARPSHVLTALGLSEERVDGSLRFSLGRTTTEAEIQRAVELVVQAVQVERAASDT